MRDTEFAWAVSLSPRDALPTGSQTQVSSTLAVDSECRSQPYRGIRQLMGTCVFLMLQRFLPLPSMPVYYCISLGLPVPYSVSYKSSLSLSRHR